MLDNSKINLKKIFLNIGIILHIPAFMSLFSIFVAIIFKEYFAIPSFFVCFAVFFLFAHLLFQIFRKDSGIMSVRDAMVIAAVGWVVASFFGALVYFFIGKNSPSEFLSAKVFTSFINSLFESFSGFTSTGLTMIKFPENLPHVLQWWRSLQSWLGGMGLIIFIISIVEPRKEEYCLYYAEGKYEQLDKNIAHTAQKLYFVYLAYTVFIFFLFFITKMPIWDSINHAMTGIATGGFSISNTSIAKYGVSSQIVAIFAMVVGSTSFAFHYRMLKERKFIDFIKNKQHLLLYILFVIGGLFLVFFDKIFRMDIGVNSSFFQWISSLSTCGFTNLKVLNLLPSVKLFLIFGMIIGGASGSTSGGFKIRRLISLFSGIFLRLKKVAITKKYLIKEMKETVVHEKEIADISLPKSEKTSRLYSANVLFSLWIFFIVLFWFLLMLQMPEVKPINVLFDIASALGNVGMSTGIVNVTLSIFQKSIFIFLMWIGRLEIIPIIILFSSVFIKYKKQ
ncbi:MAG: hypothetical protein AMS24_01105 [Chlamydiae bacterium SM23_39]|nr:MAG: hypothetical protein AMS24_01105 [Chlamydiae bacterium SM23_39]